MSDRFTGNLKAINTTQETLGVTIVSQLSAYGVGVISYSVNRQGGSLYSFDLTVTPLFNQTSSSVYNTVSNVIESIDSNAFIQQVNGTTASFPTQTSTNQNPTGSGFVSYVVKAGDTLTKIANAFRTSVQSIATLNKITNINNISVGKVLIIDSGNNSTTPVVNATQAQQVIKQNQQTTGQNTPVINPSTPNDNWLEDTAKYFGISVSVLAIGAFALILITSKRK
jgi:LysM repeat protein